MPANPPSPSPVLGAPAGHQRPQRFALTWTGGVCALVLLAGATVAAAEAPAPITRAEVQHLDAAARDPASVLDAETLRSAEEIQRQAEAAINDPDHEIHAMAARGKGIAMEAFASPGEVDPDHGPVPEEAKKPAYRLFLSQSMPQAELTAALRIAAKRRDLALVFIGMKQGQTLRQLMEAVRIGEVIDYDAEEAPMVQIDPPSFRKSQVSVVPTLAHYDSQDKLIASARGVMRPEWLAERVDHGRRGDLGSFGPTYAIIEQNQLELMRQRLGAAMADVDPEQVVSDFFAGIKTAQPPFATQDAVWSFDPSFTVKQTVRTPDGIILALAGTRINPLERLPFTQTLFVFNGTSPRQIEIVERELAARPQARAVLMTTTLPPQQPQQALAALMERFGRDVFMYLPDFAARFPVKHVPAVIEAAGNRFQVSEFAVTVTSNQER